MTAAVCPDCAADVDAADNYCEACGRALGTRRIAFPHNDIPTTACVGCGGTRYDADRYCARCGELCPAPDRFEADLGAVCVLTDRGIAHACNEDAVAAAVLDGEVPGRPAAVVIVVCDGVSSSEDPQAASGAGARTGVEAALAALAGKRSADAAVMAGLEAAAQAVCATAAHDGSCPSCTYVSAVVCDHGGARGVEIAIANVGDSRAYWLRTEGPSTAQDDGNPPSQRLTVDDSWAQALVDAGAMDEEPAMNDPRAHTLLRWLGADGGSQPWSDNCVRTLRTTGPGVLLLCTDGLWNYQSDAGSLAPMATGAAPLSAARELAEFALRSGGSDNITVALAPVRP